MLALYMTNVYFLILFHFYIKKITILTLKTYINNKVNILLPRKLLILSNDLMGKIKRSTKTTNITKLNIAVFVIMPENR